jgi:uncharacterized protein (DUF1697 family)
MSAATHVALLRGVNVGGKNRLPMADLVALVHEAGGRDARTFIQSGNAVFRAPPRARAGFEAKLSKAIAARFGFSVPVVLRSVEELRRVAEAHPLAAAGHDHGKQLHVGFLAAAPAADRVAGLDPARSPPDAFVVRGSEIYLLAPNGLARTKLTNAYFDGKLGTTSTFRNWATVQALLAMAEGRDAP